MIGGDAGELDNAAAGGPAQAFTLDHRARVLAAAAVAHRRRSPTSRVDALPDTARLHALARAILRLDHWVLLVASALRAADADPVRSRLLAFGAHHPASRAVLGTTAVATALPVAPLDDEVLAQITGWPRLGGAWRDRVGRERARRWIAALPARLDAVAPTGHGPVDLLATAVDRHVLTRVTPLTDLHHSAEEHHARRLAETAGLRWLLAQPDLTVWSFAPTAGTDRPTVRLALGDPATARSVAVVLPGTGSGVHDPAASLARARALHTRAREHARRRGRDPDEVAVVLDLYDAPTDLGRAADPAPARVAGRATAVFLADLPAGRRRTVLVGHSYGALAAARAAGTEHDALVVLGAPGLGVTHRRALPVPTVWAARTPDDPIGAVADLDELVAALPPRLRTALGPLAHPLAAHGPDPSDEDFGARVLPTAAPAGSSLRDNHGHGDYLADGTVVLDAVARIVLGPP